MKILVIQLTRLGDILCTLPVLSALRRENPEAQIHLLVRQKFAAAAEGARCIDHLWRLDAVKVLGAIITENKGIDEGLGVVTSLVNELRAEKFDKVINLSFSPSSSFITHLVAQKNTQVLGYTRTSDFYLHIPDGPSQYFRAQVGLERSNRIHVADLFAMVAGVQIKDSDWNCPGSVEGTQKAGIVCHLGASQNHKVWPADYWISLISRLLSELSEDVTIIGSAEEKILADNICLQVGSSKVKNLAGQTPLPVLARTIQGAKLFIGADSGPLHVANAVRTKSLNLSVGKVRFWETGPTVSGSRVLQSFNPSFLSTDTVFNEVRAMLNGEAVSDGAHECTSSQGIRFNQKTKTPSDHWPLVDWIYFQGPAPDFRGDIQKALGQINEVSTIALSQLHVLFKSPDKVEVISIMDRLDEVLKMLGQAITPLSPLIDDYFVQKENINPGSREEIFYQTQICYEHLQSRSQMLLPSVQEAQKGI